MFLVFAYRSHDQLGGIDDLYGVASTMCNAKRIGVKASSEDDMVQIYDVVGNCTYYLMGERWVLD